MKYKVPSTFHPIKIYEGREIESNDTIELSQNKVQTEKGIKTQITIRITRPVTIFMVCDNIHPEDTSFDDCVKYNIDTLTESLNDFNAFIQKQEKEIQDYNNGIRS